MYQVGQQYTRKDIYRFLGIPKDKQGGDWLNGYHREGNDYYIFCNVGTPGRTGHDYDNHWDGEKLVWHGKTKSHFGQQTIQNLLSGEFRVFIFYRSESRDPFTFAGIGKPIPDYSIEKPVRIDWVFSSEDLDETAVYPDEYPEGTEFKEGSRTKVYVNRYERDRRARDVCITHHGTNCSVCNFDFGRVFGEIGDGFIHVHHRVPVSQIGEDYEVDPVEDMVPVCPNCHAMLHKRNPPYSVEELRELMRKNG